LYYFGDGVCESSSRLVLGLSHFVIIMPSYSGQMLGVGVIRVGKLPLWETESLLGRHVRCSRAFILSF